MREQQQPKSFFELEEIIREMEVLEREKEKENSSKSASSNGHSTDTSTELLSDSQLTKSEDLWVKRVDGENIWDNFLPKKIDVPKKKKKSRKMIFSSLSECPFSHTKSRDSGKRVACLNSPESETTKHSFNISISETEEKVKSPKYRKQYVAEFYGTNTIATDLPPNNKFSKEKIDEISPNAQHQVRFAVHRNTLRDVTNELYDCAQTTNFLPGNLFETDIIINITFILCW